MFCTLLIYTRDACDGGQHLQCFSVFLDFYVAEMKDVFNDKEVGTPKLNEGNIVLTTSIL